MTTPDPFSLHPSTTHSLQTSPIPPDFSQQSTSTSHSSTPAPTSSLSTSHAAINAKRPSSQPALHAPSQSQPTSQTIMAQFTDLMIQNELLAKENRLFDSFLQRHTSTAGHDDGPTNMKSPKSSSQGGRRSTIRQNVMEMTLTDAEKSIILADELTYRQKQLSALEQRAHDDTSLLRAIIDGIKIRIGEMRKETYEFQRDIVINAENTRTGKIMAERVVRYFEEKLREKSALIEKLKLKNKAMKTHRQKMDGQVRHKEEQGDSLKSIDFHQLQIKNYQFTQKINERNNDLLKLKMTTGKTVQILNTAKRQLADLALQTKSLKKQIRDRESAKIKLAQELQRVQNELSSSRSRNKKYKIQQSNPDMPQVMDYVSQKSVMYQLQASVHNWTRKVEIAEMAAKRARASLHATMRQLGIASSSPILQHSVQGSTRGTTLDDAATIKFPPVH